MKGIHQVAIALAVSLPMMNSFAAKTETGDKIDLKTIEARLAALEAVNAESRLSSLETVDAENRITALESTSYDGTYTVTIMEAQQWGCQPAGTDVASVLTDENGATNYTYLVNQQQSSTSSRSASYEATSLGGTLEIPLYELITHEMDLSGIASDDARNEGEISPVIDGTGAITFDAGPDVDFSGQFSADGSTFTILAQGNFVDKGCNDNFMVMGVGVRK